MCSTACEASFRPLIVRDPCGADIETEIGSLSRGNTDRMWLSPGLESRMIPELLCFPCHCPGLTTRGPVVSQAPALLLWTHIHVTPELLFSSEPLLVLETHPSGPPRALWHPGTNGKGLENSREGQRSLYFTSWIQKSLLPPKSSHLLNNWYLYTLWGNLS